MWHVTQNNTLVAAADPVNHPPHYTWIPGIQCIDVVQHFPFNRGNIIKYTWRAGRKGGPEQELEDMRKVLEYAKREIARLEGAK